MNMNLELSQKQLLSPNMVQSMEILQMSTMELESYMENMALENPVIEFSENTSESENERENDLQRKLDWLESTDQQNKVYYQQDHDPDNLQQDLYDKRQEEESLSEYLLSQILLSNYTPQEHDILEYLILSLDEKGYYTDAPAIAAEHFSCSEDTIFRLLADIKKLDPAGVGAKDLQECLLLQLYRKPNYSLLTEKIIQNHMMDIAKNHLHLIAANLDISIDDVMDCCEEIRTFQPKPGSHFSNRENLRYITPDVVVVKLEQKFEILITDYRFPKFTINTFYQNLQKTTTDEEAKRYLTEKIKQANWVESCIEQRTSTLSKVMHVLVQLQNNFFLYGPGNKCPMQLADIANELNLHESTVSRALRGKYLQCSWGIFPLNYFLTSAVSKTAENSLDKTPDQVKQLLKKIIDEEDKTKPYSDQALCQKLAEYDVTISRRTVNKYRLEMNYPDKSGRKIWK